MTTVAIIDFETTGMRGDFDRIIEVGAAIVQDGEVVATFAELMNPGFPIPYFITNLTGITTAMVRHSPPPQAIMPRLRAFLGEHPCVAHNASFDQRFFEAEMTRAGQAHARPFLCTVLLARRLVHDAPSHKLGVLADHLRLPKPAGMRAHRALADVLVTCELWKHLRERVRERLGGTMPTIEQLQALTKLPKKAIDSYFSAV